MVRENYCHNCTLNDPELCRKAIETVAEQRMIHPDAVAVIRAGILRHNISVISVVRNAMRGV
jgi:hypothetical protein